MTYSHMANATLPSAMRRFTSEFGMGSGGSNALLSSGKPVGQMPCSFAIGCCPLGQQPRPIQIEFEVSSIFN